MKPKVIVGTQWGDEGKGKYGDRYSLQWADIVVAVNGGNNSGRTVWDNGAKYVFHSLGPSLLHNKPYLIGAGTANDPLVLRDDIMELNGRRFHIDKLGIDPRAHVVMPYHIALDIAQEERRSQQGIKIGTTSRGIGPCYTDRKSRSGIRFADFVRPEIFEPKFRRNAQEKSEQLKLICGKSLEDFLKTVSKDTYRELAGKSIDELFAEYSDAARFLRNYLMDVSEITYDAIKSGKNVLFETRQAAGLDNDFGTYHYCTSSNTIAGTVFTGVGLPPMDLEVIGIAKAYCTKVGPGPFPSEIREVDIANKVREVGKEYGATTGRPRRVGWFDVPQMKLSNRLNGLNELILTKLDVLSGLDEVQVVRDYELGGRSQKQRVPIVAEDYLKVSPIYETFGSIGKVAGITNYEDLSEEAKRLINYIEAEVGVPIKTISTGPDRNENITRQ